MNPDWKPRLSVEITVEQAQKLRDYIPHGLQGQVVRLIVDDLITMMERCGPAMVLSAFIDRMVTVENISGLKDLRHGDDS